MILPGEIRALLPPAGQSKLADVLSAVNRLGELDFSWPQRARVRLLRNLTCEPLVPLLRLEGFRRLIRIDIDVADYDTYAQEIVDAGSATRRESCDMIVLALWLDLLPMAFDAHGALNPDAVLDHVGHQLALLRRHTGALIGINTFLPPMHSVGAGDAAALARLNAGIHGFAGSDGRVLVADFGRYVESIGRASAVDPRYYFMYKSPLQPAVLHMWAESLATALASQRGLVKKVLALDCDNTLWGGIVGEDGLNGIKLSPHDYPGNVFHTFQRQVLQLQRQGVLLALCTKNNEADVLEVLDAHPHALLRREHFAAWRINWENKADNLAAIARDLRIGLDAFVFIDDSPVECDLVRQLLPAVEVLRVPERVHLLPGLLAGYTGFFKMVTTADDLARTAQYQSERQRTAEASQAANLDEYLASLQLVAQIGPATADETARIAQLTQRTNQFNLTTRRYAPGEIEKMQQSPDCAVLAMHVRDKFGDYGLTGAAIVMHEHGIARIDTFLMSCRILVRRLEDALLAETVARAQSLWNVGRVTAEFLPTAKNAQVSDFFDKRGFTQTSGAEMEKRYVLDLPATALRHDNFITVERRN